MKIGDSLPHFSLNDADGKLRSSDEFLNGKHLVLFFYPKNNTAGCTAEVCAFRDVYQDFLDVDCAVVGVSGDTVVSHALFADKHRLPYPILSDAQGTLRKAMQVPKKLFGIIPGRVTYIFNPAGKLIHITNDLMDAEKHVKEALEVIRSVE
jgi:peroxiredoxin Q/BCP